MKTSELSDFNKTALIDDNTDIKPISGYPYLVIFLEKTVADDINSSRVV